MKNSSTYVGAAVIAGIFVGLAIFPTLLATHSVSATVDISSSVKEKKTHTCNEERHTVSYCDGFAAGEQDRRQDNPDRCHDKSHTSKWRSGYHAGYQNC